MRLRFIEAECEGVEVGAAIRALGEMFQGQPGAPAVVVDAVPALPAPAVVEERQARKKARAPRASEATDEQGPRPGELAMAALQGGPKTAEEVLAYIRTHGMPDYKKTRTSVLLNYLKGRGKVVLLDGNWWKLA